MRGLTDAVLRDLRHAIRALAAQPGWTIAAVLCVAIAAGANTAAFTVVNGLLLRPLPFDEPDRLVMVALREQTAASTRPFALREYRELSARATAAARLLARTHFPLSLATDDGARMAQAELVSGNYFLALQVRPFLGHFFDEQADREGRTPTIVLSHRLWQDRFGSDPAVLGRPMRVNGRPAVVIGVASPQFVGAMQLVATDLWLPAAMYPDLAGSPDASTVPMFGVMGRLLPGLSLGEAQDRLAAIATTAIAPRHGEAPPTVVVTAASGFGVPVAVEGVVLTFSAFLYAMMALLIAVACANVAGLVLARGAGRVGDIAVRLSLGASRRDIARYLLVENAILALAGCVTGTVVALWATQAFVTGLVTPFEYVSYAIDVRPDARVFACAVAGAALTVLLCGIAPIRVAHRVDVTAMLRRSGATGGSRASARTLNALVVGQLAVSTALLVGAGMLVRAWVGAWSAAPAFETSGLVAATLDVAQAQLDRTAGTRLYEALVERLSAVRDVVDVGLASAVPLRPGRTATVRADTGPGSPSSRAAVDAAAVIVSSGYLDALGLAVRQGRFFTNREPSHPRVAVIDETMARRLWPDGSPLGRTFRVNAETEPLEIIGVVPPLDGSRVARSAGTFYRPFPHEFMARMTLLLRVRGDARPAFAAVRQAVRAVNDDLSIIDLRTVDQWRDLSAAQHRIPTSAFSLVALLGVALSTVGLYGVVAYSVRGRARELGIRLALGAAPADIRRLVLRQGCTIVALGVGAGAAGSVGLALIVRRTLFGVGALDATTFGVACGLLSGAAFAALVLPVRWASRIAPALTLRAE